MKRTFNMIKIDREKLVKMKGKIEIPEFNIDINKLSNLCFIVNTLIDLLISNSTTESYE